MRSYQMETEQKYDVSKAEDEQLTTTGNDVEALNQGHPVPNRPTSDPNLTCEMKPDEVIRNLQNVTYIYRQDIVKSNNTGKIGIVTEVAGDSDSDGSITDDEQEEEDEDEEEEEEKEGNDNNEHKADENEEGNMDGNTNANESIESKRAGDNSKSSCLPADQVRVAWTDESETIQNISDVTVVDRRFLHGDYVASDPTGQVGIVVDVNISVDLLTNDGSVIKDVSSRDLKRIRDFTVGDYVVLGTWLGRIDDVADNVTVLFDDGSLCKVTKADPLRLKPVGKNIIEDGHFPYYPGQRVKASYSSVFKNSRWLSGFWRASRLEGTVAKVTVGSVFIYWVASAGYGPDSSTTPAEEQGPKNLKLLTCFAHANWQLGDWCLLPSPGKSSSIPLEKGLSKLEIHDSTNSDSESTQARPKCDSEVVTSEGSNENNGFSDINMEAVSDANTRNGESTASAGSGSYSTLLSVSKEPIHERWPLHRKKIRKVVVRRDKKTRKKEDNFERALLIVNANTKVDVAWQDGTIERGLNCTALIPVDSPGDHEFVSEQYVVEKSTDESDVTSNIRRVGVVKCVNSKERTAHVRWLKPVTRAEDPKEFDKEEVVSVYELEGHPDYDYCYGDMVVRLSPISEPVNAVPAEEPKQVTDPNEVKRESKMHFKCKKLDNTSMDDASVESSNFSDLSWFGNITGLRNGAIEVTWADGMISMVGPRAIYVVGRDDDDDSIAGGSEFSDDAASWETVDDNEMDAIEDSKEDLRLQTVADISPESKESTMTTENSGRNGPLSIPLAALGFMTRLASGIFSRGQKHIDPSSLDTESENEIQFQGAIAASERRDSGDESSSQRSNNIDDYNALSTHGKGEEQFREAAELMDAAEALCNLRNEGPKEPSKDEGVTSSFKGFDIAKDPYEHYFVGANGQNNARRKWLKKVQQDWSVLQNNLPDGIYVRVYEDRMDLLRAVIVGAYGTPYQDGLFFFDFHLPPEYPDVPPSAYYHSGGWRINPNLYEEGKVCLSLLNTWTGRGNEVWDPSSSSILQVLVSLQGLVLNSRPYFNEAGYDKQIGTAEGEKNSVSYNENTFLLNCKTMMYLMRKPPKNFEELVSEHFGRRGYFILKACDAYMKGYLIGSLAKDASISERSNVNANSVGFKLMLAKIVPKLYAALVEVGADCSDFKHLQQI